jgi:hypothetical protein
MLLWSKYFAVPMLVIAGAIVFLCWMDRSLWREPSPSGPQTMKDVKAVAQKLRLHCCSDRQDGAIEWRLIVSESPITWEHAGNLRVTYSPEDPDWTGNVAVYRKLHGNMDSFLAESNCAVAWGKFLLYGDPALIERLTSRTAPDPQ